MPYAPSVFLPCLTLRVFRCLLPLHPKQIFSLISITTPVQSLYTYRRIITTLYFSCPQGTVTPYPKLNMKAEVRTTRPYLVFVHHTGVHPVSPLRHSLFYHCSFILVNFGHYALMQKRPEIMFRIRPYLDLIIVSFRAINPDDVWQVKQIMRLRPITSGVCSLSHS